jgi:REP element-mobilizing transposase RayT
MGRTARKQQQQTPFDANDRRQQMLFDANGRPAVLEGKALKRRQPRAKKRRRTPGVKLGRPPKGARAGAPHKPRPELKRYQPVHVVLRVVREIGSLRKRHMYKALREATIAVARRELAYKETGVFRIVHVSIQRDHVHLLVEADHKLALSRGMQSFQISAAKHLNRARSVRRMDAALRAAANAGARVGREGAAARRSAAYRQAMAKRRRGTVFPDRFHQEIITSPKQARRALAYVLNNWRKHREDAHDFARDWRVDPYSTGVFFDGWRERANAHVYMPYRDDYQPLVVYLPTTWLLHEGWRKHGLIPFELVPGASSTSHGRARYAQGRLRAH